MTMHFSGGLRIYNSKGGLSIHLAGWPVCVSGDRARRLRAHGAITSTSADVTCKKCLLLIRKASVQR